MKLRIYLSCSIEDIGDYESWVELAWTTEAPRLGELVSMGREKCWQIVKVIVYGLKARHKMNTAINNVYIAYVNPVDKPIPPENHWNSWPKGDSLQSFHIGLVLIGHDAIEIEAFSGIEVPKVGEIIESIAEPTEEGLIFHDNPKFWRRKEVFVYTPIAEMQFTTPRNANFARTFLGWCEPLEVDSQQELTDISLEETH